MMHSCYNPNFVNHAGIAPNALGYRSSLYLLSMVVLSDLVQFLIICSQNDVVDYPLRPIRSNGGYGYCLPQQSAVGFVTLSVTIDIREKTVREIALVTMDAHYIGNRCDTYEWHHFATRNFFQKYVMRFDPEGIN